MSHVHVLHYVTQWLWLSDSFVHGPIAAGSHRSTVVSRGPVVNEHVYRHPAVLTVADGAGVAPAEGDDTADAAVAALAGTAPVDVVHLHHGYGLPDALAIAGRLGVPLVVSFWGYDVTALPRTRPDLYRGAFDRVAKVVVPSTYLLRVVERLGAPASKLVRLPGSVDTTFFAPTPVPDEPRVAFVGRFARKKGIDLLCSAWAAVRARVPGAELRIVGYGDGIEALVVGAGPGVTVEPPDAAAPRAQVRDLIRWCRVYVSPSRTGPDGDAESQHIGNLEAQASGRPVVTTDHGGIPEFVQAGRTGLVVPEGDAGALAGALCALLADAPRCAAMAAAAQAWAATFDVRARAAALDRLYEEVASSSSTRTGR